MDNIAVRLGMTGGDQFRGEMLAAGAASERAMGQVGRSSRAGALQLQNAAYQIGDFAVQVGGGTSALRAFGQQAPQLLGAFGPVGAIVGTGVAVFAALAGAMFGASGATKDLKSEMAGMEGSVGSVDSAVSALRGTQEAYTDAISASAGASAASASAVIANSAAEFSARKEVLRIELELLRIRGVDRAAQITNLQDQYKAGASAAGEADATYRYATKNRPFTTLSARRRMGDVPTPNLDTFVSEQKMTRLAIDKLRAEAALDQIALDKGEGLLGTDFSSLQSGVGKRGGSRGGSGGAGSGAKAIAAEAEKVFYRTRTAAEKYSAELVKLQALHRSGAIDSDTFARAQEQLKQQFSDTSSFAKEVASTVRSGFSSLFESIVDGGKNAGEVIEGVTKKLLAMMLEQQGLQLLAGAFPNVFGAGGFLDVTASAKGNVISQGRLQMFAAGGVVNGPTLFPMRGGLGLMGEAGAEAILPLSRINGTLGVRASGGGGSGTVVQVINNSGQTAREERSRGPDGREMVRVIVGEEMTRGGFDRPMKRYGATPEKVKR